MAAGTDDRTSPRLAALCRRMRHPLLFRLFLLGKMPLGLLAGLRIDSLDDQRCAASVPYGWRTTNPFRSTYFAALSMAAELATGALALQAVRAVPASVSMLIVSMEAAFEKKATARATFTCSDGVALRQAVERAAAGDQGVSAETESVGRLPDGTVVARFRFRWSFRRRGGVGPVPRSGE